MLEEQTDHGFEADNKQKRTSDPPKILAVPVSQYKIFNDPIHGSIELHPLCVDIIDTPQFQRLRYIKQLGACYFVYPGASHNRFEHSLGVCYLAGELLTAIKQRQPELGITDQDMLCVQIAGLCHDLGHGPFSHMFEDFIHTVRPDLAWRHEMASVQMFEHLLEVNNLWPKCVRYGLTKRDLICIKEQIAGPLKSVTGKQWPYSGRDEKKSFLYEIVANKRNGIDVDKWDYFARDCHHLGMSVIFNHGRFIKFCRVIGVDGELQICNRDKEVLNIYDMFHARSMLHRKAYQHRSAKIVEIMITEALQKADPFIEIEGKDRKVYKISECIEDPAAYTKLTDYIYHQILYSSDPQLSPACDILNQIECRKLYKFVGQTKPKDPSSGYISKEDISLITKQMASSVLDRSGKPLCDYNDVVLSLISIDFGKWGEDPIDSVRFYTKDNVNRAFKINKEEVLQFLPSHFCYQFIYVYSRRVDAESFNNLLTCFHQWCKDNNMMKPQEDNDWSLEMTP